MIKKMILCVATASFNSSLFGASSPSHDSAQSKALIRGTLAVSTALTDAQTTKILTVFAKDLVQWVNMCKISEKNKTIPTGFTPPHSRLSPSRSLLSYPSSPSRSHFFYAQQKEKAATITIIRFIDHLPFDLAIEEIKEFFPNFKQALYPGKTTSIASSTLDDDSNVSSSEEDFSDSSFSENSEDVSDGEKNLSEPDKN